MNLLQFRCKEKAKSGVELLNLKLTLQSDSSKCPKSINSSARSTNTDDFISFKCIFFAISRADSNAAIVELMLISAPN